MTHVKLKLTLANVYPWLLIIGGAIGLIASLILSHDTLAIAQNPHYIPSCNLNPVVSCGDVITFKGDSILGLPYPFYGIAAFGAVLAAGVGMIAGAKYKKWFFATLQAFVSVGIIGAYYLLLKSMFEIHALCPFCLSVDVVTTTLFWYTTLYNIDSGIILTKFKSTRCYRWIRKHHLDILLFWFVLVIIFILHHFWYYYGKHL